MNKLRILLNTNAMWSTSGYGQQAAELLPLFRDYLTPGAVAASNFFGQAGGIFELNGIKQYPVINHTYGSDCLVLHGKDHQADVVFTLQDTWVLHPNDLQQTNRWIPICPIDHDPASVPVLQNLKFAYRIVSYSKFGEEQLKKAGYASTYIPHTVNTEVFKPMNKPERKQAGGLPPDCFLVGMVAANKENPPRKSFQEAMDAFKLFLEKEPKALLYIHSNPEFPGGFDFRQYAHFIGIADKLLIPDNYVMNFKTGKEEMAKIYNTFDVLIAPSTSEGFGVPIIEAQACGVPAIVNDWTSMPELVRPGVTGEICAVATKRYSQQGSYMGIPSTASLVEKLVTVRQGGNKYKDEARKHIERNYDTKKVFKERWIPFLDMLEKEIYRQEAGKPIDKPDNLTHTSK